MNFLKKIKLLFTRAKNANYERALKFIKEDANKSKKPALLIAADILFCILKYGTAFNDYHVFDFCLLSGKHRKSFITLTYNNRFVSVMNDIEYRSLFEDKTKFDKKFSEFLGRKILFISEVTEDEFEKFFRENEYFYAKKDNEFGGKGVKKFKASAFKNSKDALLNLKNEGFDLVEEVIKQHPVPASFDQCLNTVRIATMLNIKGEPEILYGVFRCGNKSDTDNVSSGGFAAMVDVNTGIIITDGISKDNKPTLYHPGSGKQFKGTQLPFWDEACNMVKKAALVCPNVRYVGWDVAFTPDKCILIEGNYNPGYISFQAPDKVGKKEVFERYLKMYNKA